MAVPNNSVQSKARVAWPRIRDAKHKNGAKAWMVDARIQGRGERFFFKTKAEAETKALQLRAKRRNEGIVGVDIPDRLRVEAIEWDEKLRAVGASIPEAGKFFLDHAHPKGGKRTFAETVQELISAKERSGRRDSYLKALQWSLGVFKKTHGKRHVNEITEHDVDTWLDAQEFTLANRKAYLRDLNILFNFATKKRYSASNPVALIERPVLEEKPIEVLTIRQVVSLLTAGQENSHLEVLPALAIALFAGLRPKQELMSLDWSDVNLVAGLLTVRGRSAKDRRMRHVTISENLHAWLLPHKKADGPILKYGFRGYLERMKKLRDAAEIAHWPRDVMRHCFASYHLAHHKDVALTQDQLGHGSKSTVLWTNYRALVNPEDAALYWEIKPANKGETIMSFAADPTKP